MELNQIESGSIIGGFQLEKELGRGGMGVVYKAHELSLNRKVALKILSERLSRDEEFIKRFKREAKVVAALSHSNIVNILSYGEEGGLYYFAMEYVKGTDLGSILKEKKQLPVDEALNITLQIADALEEASTKGVVHRDLKPSNIMIDSLGRIKVTDYGIAYFQDAEAQLTHTGLYMGTPEYSSPEQASGRKLDIRSDIYSLGALLYKMVCGVPPVSGESPLAVVAKIISEPIRPIKEVNPSLPEPLCQLIDKMTAKEIDKRFQTPREVMDSILLCMQDLQIEPPLGLRVPPIPAVQPGKKDMPTNRSKRYAAAAGIILAILLSMWTVDALLNRSEEKKQPVETFTQSAQEAPHLSPATTKETESEKMTKQAAAVKQHQPAASGELAAGEQLASTAPQQKQKILPKIPVVMTIVSGDESLVPLFRVHLETMLAQSGLQIASITDIPVLVEKMQMGDMPITWHSIERLVPDGTANILLISQVQKTGTMPLQYYGRSQLLTTVSLSVQAVDMETGLSAGRPAASTAKYTPMNMDEEIRKAASSAAATIGASIRNYWQQKLTRKGSS